MIQLLCKQAGIEVCPTPYPISFAKRDRAHSRDDRADDYLPVSSRLLIDNMIRAIRGWEREIRLRDIAAIRFTRATFALRALRIRGELKVLERTAVGNKFPFHLFILFIYLCIYISRQDCYTQHSRLTQREYSHKRLGFLVR